jgi:C2 domain
MGSGRRTKAAKVGAYLECFLSCSSLGSTDLPRKESLSPFAVVYFRGTVSDAFAEIARTETCPLNASPSWCTSFEVECTADEIETASLRVDIYHRVQEGVESLTQNELLGRAMYPLQNAIDAPGMHFLTPLSHPTKEREKVGILQVHMERFSPIPSRNELIEIDVTAAVLRRREWTSAAKPVPQSYEILRAHVHDDTDGRVVWLPIYRSNRVGSHERGKDYVEFSRATFTNRHMCNGDEERRVRITLHAGSIDRRTGRATDMGFVDITLRDLCEVDPTEEVFEIENENREEEREGIGSLSLLLAQPTDVGSHFELQINHASCWKYISASAGAAEVVHGIASGTGGRRSGRMGHILGGSGQLEVMRRGISRKLKGQHASRPADKLETPAYTDASHLFGSDGHVQECASPSPFGPTSSVSLFSEDSQSVEYCSPRAQHAELFTPRSLAADHGPSTLEKMFTAPDASTASNESKGCGVFADATLGRRRGASSAHELSRGGA